MPKPVVVITGASQGIGAAIAKTFARGAEPVEFPRLERAATGAGARDVFVFFINGAKERAPAAAQATALSAALGDGRFLLVVDDVWHPEQLEPP